MGQRASPETCLPAVYPGPAGIPSQPGGLLGYPAPRAAFPLGPAGGTPGRQTPSCRPARSQAGLRCRGIRPPENVEHVWWAPTASRAVGDSEAPRGTRDWLWQTSKAQAPRCRPPEDLGFLSSDSCARWGRGDRWMWPLAPAWPCFQWPGLLREGKVHARIWGPVPAAQEFGPRDVL